MAKIKQDLQSKNQLDTAQYADDVVAHIDGNVNFATPVPALTEIGARSAKVRAGLMKVSDLKTQLSTAQDELRHDVSDLKGLLSAEGTYVQGVADAAERAGSGDPEMIIKSAGMGVQAPNVPVGAMPRPENLGVSMGDRDGQIDAHCDSVKGASSYVWETCADPDPNAGAWSFALSTTKSSATLEHLVPGALVWVRVSAVGSEGTGPPSAPMSARVG